jgi:hypothetical protein
VLFVNFIFGCSKKLELINGNFYQQDNKVIYADNGDDSFSYFFKGHKGELKDVDIKSFVYVGFDYAKDKNHVYYMSFPIKKVDVTSFELISSNFAKDKNLVFAKNEVIKGIDIKTLSRLGEYYNDTSGKKRFSEYYIRDKDQIFYLDKKVELPDVNSFKPMQWNAMDKANYYHGARKEK